MDPTLIYNLLSTKGVIECVKSLRERILMVANLV